MTRPHVVVLGPPGAGKTAQARRIADEYDLELVDTGEILRANEAMETDFGAPKEYVERGELVPDPIVNEVVGEVLSGVDGAVLDGYPRTLEQAEFLDGIADPDLVVSLDADEETAAMRLTEQWVCESCGEEVHVDDLFGDDEESAGGEEPTHDEKCPECGGELVRADDELVHAADAGPEAAQTRVEEYYEETAEVVEFYRQRGTVADVDPERPPDEVWRDVREAVEAAV